MSKKKAFSGNTMTLKDFHGGSIPTDLPLPSAPGVVVRSSDRPGYDRTTSWGNPMGRSDHRSRPNSSHSTKHLDDKTPFLTHTAHIGRNFDEDERKPLDGISAPRRTVSDDSFRVPASSVELKLESVSTGRVTGWQGLAPLSPLSSGAVSSYSGKVNDAAHVGLNSQSSGGNSGHAVSGAYPNAWVVRKEVTVGVTDPAQSAWSGQTSVSKFAHASALEKVSSGRWQSKLSLQYQADAEVIKYSEPGRGICSKNLDDTYNRIDVVGGREYSDATLARHVERGLNIEEVAHGGKKDLPDYERTRGPTYLEVKERKPTTYADGVQSTHSDGKFGGTEMQPTVPSEVSERPKLKLLPRTKPLENVEIPAHDPKQGQLPSNSVLGHAETGNELHGNVIPPNPGLAGNESVNQAVERPKLNLKPRSQPLEPLQGNIEKERKAVFGGARPREMVLRERGVDDVAINHHELGQHSDRVKHNVPKTERVPEPAIPSHHGERTENIPLDQRTGRKFEKKDNRGDVERVDVPRRNWRNENWRNNRENERQQQQQQQEEDQEQERHSSPERWRKPVEHPKPASPDGTGLRYGKAASAVELAQAFSRSFSDPKADDQYSMQRDLPGQTQKPFSRLMRPTPRQINGY